MWEILGAVLSSLLIFLLKRRITMNRNLERARIIGRKEILNSCIRLKFGDLVQNEKAGLQALETVGPAERDAVAWYMLSRMLENNCKSRSKYKFFLEMVTDENDMLFISKRLHISFALHTLEYGKKNNLIYKNLHETYYEKYEKLAKDYGIFDHKESVT